MQDCETSNALHHAARSSNDTPNRLAAAHRGRTAGDDNSRTHRGRDNQQCPEMKRLSPNRVSAVCGKCCKPPDVSVSRARTSNNQWPAVSAPGPLRGSATPAGLSSFVSFALLSATTGRHRLLNCNTLHGFFFSIRNKVGLLSRKISGSYLHFAVPRR